MIDSDGYRPNVGIVLVNLQDEVFWGRRIGQDAWQFPQGGVNPNETPTQALYRELYEEIGLKAQDVSVLGCSQDWLRYRIPNRLQRHHQKPLCIGQKQKWFLLRLIAPEQKIRLDLNPTPEFDSWCWVDYQFPAKHVVEFKRGVYDQALTELRRFLQSGSEHA